MTHQYCAAVHHQHVSLTGSVSNIVGNTEDWRFLCGEEALLMFQVGKMSGKVAETHTETHKEKKNLVSTIEQLMQIGFVSHCGQKMFLDCVVDKLMII